MHPSVQKFLAAAQERGLVIEIVEFAEATRTALQAADAIGCDVGQIVKSLCFMVNGVPTMALVSGRNRLDEKKLATLCGVGRKKVKRATADEVKSATGFSIGGVPPLGHTVQMQLFVDKDLCQHDTIWAAAGTPHSVFPIAPGKLVDVCAGTAVELKKD